MSAVHSPDHYTVGGVEAIDYIAAKLGPDGFRAYCLGNVLKYLSRWQHKDGEQDLDKALVYLAWAKDRAPSRAIPPDPDPVVQPEIVPHDLALAMLRDNPTHPLGMDED